MKIPAHRLPAPSSETRSLPNGDRWKQENPDQTRPLLFSSASRFVGLVYVPPERAQLKNRSSKVVFIKLPRFHHSTRNGNAFFSDHKGGQDFKKWARLLLPSVSQLALFRATSKVGPAAHYARTICSGDPRHHSHDMG